MATCHVSLRTQTPSAKALARPPRTLAEHLLRRRQALGLTQSQVAARLGMDRWTIRNWEQGRCMPRPSRAPAVHAFLGFCPILSDWVIRGVLRREGAMSRSRR